jgi:hypothetical protein
MVTLWYNSLDDSVAGGSPIPGPGHGPVTVSWFHVQQMNYSVCFRLTVSPCVIVSLIVVFIMVMWLSNTSDHHEDMLNCFI